MNSHRPQSRPERFIFFFLLFSLAASAHASDYQFRSLLHGQLDITKSGLGIAGWHVFPDLTAKDNTYKSLVVLGPVKKWGKSWAEVMGGTIINEKRRTEQLANLRAFGKNIYTLDFTADVEYFFKDERIYLWFGVVRPFKASILNYSIGVETENTIKKNKKDSWGAGPRVSVPLPFLKGSSLTAAYEFRNDRDFIRNYLLINF